MIPKQSPRFHVGYSFQRPRQCAPFHQRAREFKNRLQTVSVNPDALLWTLVNHRALARQQILSPTNLGVRGSNPFGRAITFNDLATISGSLVSQKTEMGSVWEAGAGASHRFDQPTPRYPEGDENLAAGSGSRSSYRPHLKVHPYQELACRKPVARGRAYVWGNYRFPTTAEPEIISPTSPRASARRK